MADKAAKEAAAAKAAEAKAKVAADAKKGIGGKRVSSVMWSVKGKNNKKVVDDDDDWVKME